MSKKLVERTPFGSRMFESRKKAGLSQEVACSRIGCSQGTLSELERIYEGSALTSQFADLYKVSPKWLSTGKGSKELSIAPTKAVDSENLTSQELRLIEVFRSLSDEKERAIAIKTMQLRVNESSELRDRAVAPKKGEKAA